MTDAPDAPSGDDDVPPLTRRDAGARQEPGSDAQDPSQAFQEHMRAMRTGVESQMAHARAEFDQANERIKERTGRDLDTGGVPDFGVARCRRPPLTEVLEVVERERLVVEHGILRERDLVDEQHLAAAHRRQQRLDGDAAGQVVELPW